MRRGIFRRGIHSSASLDIMVDDTLIFDVGLHQGFDAQFYLDKGFRVVGVEAVPALCDQARHLNAEAVTSGRLAIVGKALH